MTEPNNSDKPPRSLRQIHKELEQFYRPPTTARLDAMARRMACDLAKIQRQPPPTEEQLAEITWASFHAEFEQALEELYGPESGD